VISSYIKIISILNLITLIKKCGLIIGINYTGSSSELNGCINDAQILKIFLTSKCNNMILMTDNQHNKMDNLEQIEISIKVIVC
jgi:hypothetical protein